MRISAKIDYACRALLELSLHWPNAEPLPLNDIAGKQKIPIKFLTQILINLKQLGYVESVRGKNGGYRLAKQPVEICLSDVIEGLGSIGYSIAENRNTKNVKHVMDAIWAEIDETVLQTIQAINFETICNRKRSKDNVVMFEI